MDEPPTEKVYNELARIDQFLRDGEQEIKAFYCDDFEMPDRYENRSSVKPPHHDMIERGAKLIQNAFELPDHGFDHPVGSFGREGRYILVGVGFESLLNGIHLTIDSQSFISHMEEHDDRTPSMKDSSDALFAQLPGKVPEDQRGLLRAIIELIIKFRNTEVHLGIYRTTNRLTDRLILEVTATLLEDFAPGEIQELGQIRERIKEMKTGGTGAWTDIEFSPSTSLKS